MGGILGLHEAARPPFQLGLLAVSKRLEVDHSLARLIDVRNRLTARNNDRHVRLTERLPQQLARREAFLRQQRAAAVHLHRDDPHAPLARQSEAGGDVVGTVTDEAGLRVVSGECTVRGEGGACEEPHGTLVGQ